MSFTFGLVDVLTYNNQPPFGGSGSYASPAHVVIDGFEDLDAGEERNAIGPLKIRRYDTEMSLVGLRKIDNGFTLACEPGNPVWEALWAAYRAKQPIELFAFYKFVPNVPDDGLPASGSRARRATMLIQQFSPPQKLENIDVNELKLIASLNPVDPADPDTPTIKEPEDYIVP